MRSLKILNPARIIRRNNMHEIRVECIIDTYLDNKTPDFDHPTHVSTNGANTVRIWKEDGPVFCMDATELLKAIECCQKGQS